MLSAFARSPSGVKRWALVVLAGTALTVAMSVVTMAAHSPLSGSGRVNATSAQTPATALWLMLAGAGIVALSVLAIVMRPMRRADVPQPVPPRSQIHWIWQVLAASLPFLLGAALIAAALSGAHRKGPVQHPTGGVPSSLTPLRGTGGASTGFMLPSWLPWTALALVLTAVAAGLVWVILRQREPREEGLPKPAAVSAAVEAAMDMLGRPGDSRQAVMAAYAAMERTLAARGVARASTEAPREYLHRALAAGEPGGDEARTLTALFEQARYSPHPVPERTRELALATLGSLRRRLQSEQAV